MRSRYVGATMAGPPVSGTFEVGNWSLTRRGTIWSCIAAGSPGLWSRSVPRLTDRRVG